MRRDHRSGELPVAEMSREHDGTAPLSDLRLQELEPIAAREVLEHLLRVETRQQRRLRSDATQVAIALPRNALHFTRRKLGERGRDLLLRHTSSDTERRVEE